MKFTKRAFTLSEVLITLGIIGVVAAITIPGLMAKTTQAQYDARFKKVFSTLQQAGRMAQAQYDWSYIDVNTPCGNNPATEKPTETMSLCALFNGTLKGATYLGKLSDLKDKNGNSYYNSNNGPGLELLGQIFIPAAYAMRIQHDYIAYSLSDGAIVAFDPGINSTMLESRIFVDVNGLSLPNSSIQLKLLGQIFIPPAYAIKRAGDDAAGLQVGGENPSQIGYGSNNSKKVYDIYSLYFENGELRTEATATTIRDTDMPEEL